MKIHLIVVAAWFLWVGGMAFANYMNGSTSFWTIFATLSCPIAGLGLLIEAYCHG